MFTSRAEYRTLLRQDNADIRLTSLSYELGLADVNRLKAVNLKVAKTEKLISFLMNQSYTALEANPILKNKNSAPVTQSDKINKIFSRPNVNRKDIAKIKTVSDFLMDQEIDDTVFEQAEIQIKYSGYIEKEMINAAKLNKLDNIKIPTGFDYGILSSLSHEAKEKLNKIKPSNLSQASRISGIKPSDISVLLVKLGR
jgi:tRNA uridine 5-carboxymethylaminomethyl modification enzyme